MVTSDISKVFTNYTYDTLGNLVLETAKNKSVDYEYNELNQLVKRTTTENETFTYSYDKRGNRVAETGKKESREYVYDATNRLVEGTNWKGDKSAYTYNGLGLRVNNLVTTHAGKTYDRDYVIDYTSPENDDLYVYAMGNGQLEYEQRHVYAGSERLEQITEKGTGGWERTLYVHEDVMGNTRYYTKATGQNFAELQYDAWGQPVSPNKLVNNDHGNYVFATFTGHIYDTTLDVYFAEARFYDAITRTWMAMDPIKSGLNWYQYSISNPTTYWDPTGLMPKTTLNLLLAAHKIGLLPDDMVYPAVIIANAVHMVSSIDIVETALTDKSVEQRISDELYLQEFIAEEEIEDASLSMQAAYLSMHETAQILMGKVMGNETILEKNVYGEDLNYIGEADIARGLEIWEVKPLGRSPRSQLEKYTNGTNLRKGKSPNVDGIPLYQKVASIGTINNTNAQIVVTSPADGEVYYFIQYGCGQREKVKVAAAEATSVFRQAISIADTRAQVQREIIHTGIQVVEVAVVTAFASMTYGAYVPAYG